MEGKSHALISTLCGEFKKNTLIDPELYDKWEVKRGLRNADGTGVMAGVTRIGSVHGYYMQDGERVPMEGKLLYRGIDISSLVAGFMGEDRFGYEETAYLLLFGALPTAQQLTQFNELLAHLRPLPRNFTEDMILKAPSPDVMNKLARGVLALYSYDDSPNVAGLEQELTKALGLIARVPLIVAHAFAVKRHYYDNESLYIHRPQEGLSVAENFLYALRRDNRFTREEARLLDLCLVLHAEHGGGNNSAFACRVLSSSGTDIYSSIAAAIGSLKGPKHGGANQKVMEMLTAIEEGVKDWKDEEEVSRFLARLVNRQEGDRSGLIYGMGHAIYTLSDPRAVLLREFAKEVAAGKGGGFSEELELVELVERLAPAVLAAQGRQKVVSANVDLYSGMVYRMMGISAELYTPLFAMSRISGWCAHRLEEVFHPGGRIIRPAYKAVSPPADYLPLNAR